MQVGGLAESEFHDMTNVRITDCVPTPENSLPNTLVLQEHLNFADIEYPLLDRDCCDLLIGSDHIQLLVPHDEVQAHRTSRSLLPRVHVSAGSIPDINIRWKIPTA